MLRSEDVHDSALRVLADERALLARLGVPGELVLVGGSGVPGALTRGDVDLHLRVPPGEFTTSVEILRRVHDVVHPEIWCATLATFAIAAAVDAGLAVTPVGSEHDSRFTAGRAALLGDAAVLERYNALKRAASTIGEDEYERRKSAFFDELAGPVDGPGGGARRT